MHAVLVILVSANGDVGLLEAVLVDEVLYALAAVGANVLGLRVLQLLIVLNRKILLLNQLLVLFALSVPL